MHCNDQQDRYQSNGLNRRSLLAAATAMTCSSLMPSVAAYAAPALSGLTASLILIGTQGGPNFSLTRSEPSSALQVGERLYLIDCGYGALAGLKRIGLEVQSLDAIFLTHLHDDHTSDLTAILTHMATQGRAREITVYGPPGTNGMVDAIRMVLTPNAVIRSADEKRPAGFLSFIKSAEVTPGAPFFRDSSVRVTCAENTHYPKDQPP